MAEIILSQGQNYISFPEIYQYDFNRIFTDSGIISEIPADGFKKFNPITQQSEPVSYTDFIEKGVGYYLYVNIDSKITYNGYSYTFTLDELRSKLLPNWNLVGTGSSTIILPYWCNVYDHSYNPVFQLEPTKAYWINYNECTLPVYNLGSILTVIGAIGTVLFTIYLLKEFNIIGKKD